MFVVGIIVLIAGKKFYVVRPPKGSIIINAFRALWVGLVNRGNMGELEDFKVLRGGAVLMKRAQTLPNPHTRRNMAGSTRHPGATFLSRSSNVASLRAESSSFTLYTG